MTEKEIRLLNIEDFKSLPDEFFIEHRDILKAIAFEYSTMEQSIKLVINSLYGAFANEYFHFYNVAIAETVTLQGQDAIKYTMALSEKYFREVFHLDKKLHEALGISPDFVVKPLKKPVINYCDTDSSYFVFEEALQAVEWKGTVKDFVLTVYQLRLKGFFKKILDAYAKERNTENKLVFELETISNNAIWVAKKKYVQNIIWKDGKDYDDLKFIKTTGLEIIQTSTPKFAREKLTELVKFIFSKGKMSDKEYAEMVRIIKDMKEQFKIANLESKTKNTSISDYNKYAENDTTSFAIASKCPAHLRGAVYYNYLLNKNTKYKNKYELIKSGDKVRWYYSKDPFCDVFAFKTGSHPKEFAPQMDIDRQFQSTILDPINNIIGPAGFKPLSPSLAFTIGALF